MKKLTTAQSDYAAVHHDLVYAFLNHFKYPEDEFYDVAIFGYLKAVQVYDEREDLQQLYSFSTIAFRRMKDAMAAHFKALNRPCRRAAVEPYEEDTHVSDFAESLWESPEQIICERETTETVLRLLSPEQGNLLTLRTSGHTLREIGADFNISPRKAGQKLKIVRDTVRQAWPETLAA